MTAAANIRIDRDTGEIELGAFRIGKTTTTRELRTIDPDHFDKTAADGDNFFCRFADLAIGDHRIICQSYHRDGSVLFYTFQPCFPGETWDDVNDETEARKLALLLRILKASRIANHQDFDWGHVVAKCDGRDGITSLTVAYYRRVL